MKVPYFRPALTTAEIDEVVACLQSGWLTTGPRVKRFESEFATAVGASHAVAVNSCTAALHLAMEALGLQAGQAVLVPTMTFAASAEVVRYCNAVPILVDCDPVTLNMDLNDAAKKLRDLRSGALPGVPAAAKPAGIVSVHVGGMMLDIEAVQAFAAAERMWVVEDAAHAFPAAWRRNADSPWIRCGEKTADVTCFSFYANKTITTGEGGMAVTGHDGLAERICLMSLHGLSHDAWTRYTGSGTWDYKIVAPGYKYNLTDIAGTIGCGQLARAEEMRQKRATVARLYFEAFRDVDEFELPVDDPDRIHSWHLFPIRLRLGRLSSTRNEFFEQLKGGGVHCSVHWRPLHLHPYYRDTFGWTPEACPVASSVWETLISLPIFSDMQPAEIDHVVRAVKSIASRNRLSAVHTVE
jgi:dTDP-4-amino-4,6-dideoxygalactose transaminase